MARLLGAWTRATLCDLTDGVALQCEEKLMKGILPTLYVHVTHVPRNPPRKTTTHDLQLQCTLPESVFETRRLVQSFEYLTSADWSLTTIPVQLAPLGCSSPDD